MGCYSLVCVITGVAGVAHAVAVSEDDEQELWDILGSSPALHS